MRFYIVSFERLGKATSLGATSAAEAVRAISYMQGQGWSVSRIERGTMLISYADLRVDAAPTQGRA